MSVHKVVYRGLSDIREMSVKDLKAAGVHVGGDLRWDKTTHGSRPKVFVADMTDRLAEIFRQEGTFTVTEVDEQSLAELEGVEPIAVGEPLDDTGVVVRDGVTGQETRKGESNADADPVAVAGTEAGSSASASTSGGTRASRAGGKGSRTASGTAGNGSSTDSPA